MIEVIESGGYSVDIEAFCAAGYLQTNVLPISSIGHGKGDLAAKFEAVFGGLKLDASRCNCLWESVGSGRL